MAFIPIIFSELNKISTERIIKYFLIQTSGSIIFIFSIIVLSISLIQTNIILIITEYAQILTMSSMLLKLGCAPLHQWFPSIVEGLAWFPIIVILTWQKIAPFSILINFSYNFNFIAGAARLSALLGSLRGFNQTILRKILAFSSISHLGWLIIILINKLVFFWYILIYIFLNLVLSLSFLLINIFHYSHLTFNKINSYFILTNLLSLGGLPPFLGFIPKWISITWLVLHTPFISIILISSALINLSFYLRLTYKILLIKLNFTKTFKPNNQIKILLINSLSILLFIPSLFISI